MYDFILQEVLKQLFLILLQQGENICYSRYATHKYCVQRGFQGRRSRRNCTHVILQGQTNPTNRLQLHEIVLQKDRWEKEATCNFTVLMEMKPIFLGEKGKMMWFMSFWRTWGKQEGKEGGFSSASFESRRMALLNKFFTSIQIII